MQNYIQGVNDSFAQKVSINLFSETWVVNCKSFYLADGNDLLDLPPLAPLYTENSMYHDAPLTTDYITVSKATQKLEHLLNDLYYDYHNIANFKQDLVHGLKIDKVPHKFLEPLLKFTLDVLAKNNYTISFDDALHYVNDNVETQLKAMFDNYRLTPILVNFVDSFKSIPEPTIGDVVTVGDKSLHLARDSEGNYHLYDNDTWQEFTTRTYQTIDDLFNDYAPVEFTHNEINYIYHKKEI